MDLKRQSEAIDSICFSRTSKVSFCKGQHPSRDYRPLSSVSLFETPPYSLRGGAFSSQALVVLDSFHVPAKAICVREDIKHHIHQLLNFMSFPFLSAVLQASQKKSKRLAQSALFLLLPPPFFLLATHPQLQRLHFLSPNCHIHGFEQALLFPFVQTQYFFSIQNSKRQNLDTCCFTL